MIVDQWWFTNFIDGRGKSSDDKSIVLNKNSPMVVSNVMEKND